MACSRREGLVHFGSRQEVQYLPPCINEWVYFCEGSGWGDEEAIVACRQLGYSSGIGGSLYEIIYFLKLNIIIINNFTNTFL